MESRRKIEELLDAGEFAQARELSRRILLEQAPHYPQDLNFWVTEDHDLILYCRQLAERFPKNGEARLMEIVALRQTRSHETAIRRSSEILAEAQDFEPRVLRSARHARLRSAREVGETELFVEDFKVLWTDSLGSPAQDRFLKGLARELLVISRPKFSSALPALAASIPQLKSIIEAKILELTAFSDFDSGVSSGVSE